MTTLLPAELLKLRTTRTTVGMVIAQLVLVALAIAGVLAASDRSGLDLRSPTDLATVFSHAGLASVLLLILGVMISTGEHRHHTATDTYLTTPTRTPVVVAKLLAAAVMGTGIGVVSAIIALAEVTVGLRLEGIPFDLTGPQVWRSLLGLVAWNVGYAALGVSVGALVRQQAAAIVAVLAWVGLVESVTVSLLPDLGRWLPAAAAGAAGNTPGVGFLPQVGGAAVLLGYVALFGVLAIATTVRRDVT